ncbi:5926_t:CDS:2, partial [Dentiscutata heterogama]
EQRRKFYKEAWTGEKEKRQAMEQNVNMIQENIKFILGRCVTTMVAYTEIVHHLERLDPAIIKPEVPIASEMSVESRRIVMTVFDLLEGLSEQMNESSQSRMERMEATNSGKKPDLQVLLSLTRYLFEDDSRQIVEEFLKNALKLRFVVEKIIVMYVDVKDEISFLPVTEDRTPSTSMMSTTYSPPKKILE